MQVLAEKLSIQGEIQVLRDFCDPYFTQQNLKKDSEPGCKNLFFDVAIKIKDTDMLCSTQNCAKSPSPHSLT
jgi:hypothetical protein